MAGQGRYAEVETILISTYEGMKSRAKNMPLQETRTSALKMALDRITQLYDAWDKKDRADEWQAEQRP